jgi:hypothetical protein
MSEHTPIFVALSLILKYPSLERYYFDFCNIEFNEDDTILTIKNKVKTMSSIFSHFNVETVYDDDIFLDDNKQIKHCNIESWTTLNVTLCANKDIDTIVDKFLKEEYQHMKHKTYFIYDCEPSFSFDHLAQKHNNTKTYEWFNKLKLDDRKIVKNIFDDNSLKILDEMIKLSCPKIITSELLVEFDKLHRSIGWTECKLFLSKLKRLNQNMDPIDCEILIKDFNSNN